MTPSRRRSVQSEQPTQNRRSAVQKTPCPKCGSSAPHNYDCWHNTPPLDPSEVTGGFPKLTVEIPDVVEPIVSTPDGPGKNAAKLARKRERGDRR